MSNFNDFDLDEKILKTLEEIGYNTPTPIQEQAIPKALSGLDLIASAQTGTGKTAAFMLPALNMIAKMPAQKGPKMLVLVPTRELAMQVAKEAERFSRHLPQIKTVCVYGGVGYPVQIKALSRPYDILVATPGRLIDHMQERRIDLSKLKMLVLDEADRMLDMGFVKPVEQIAAAAPKNRQTLLFSATLDAKVIRFSKKLQNDPQEIRIEPEEAEKANIEQRLYYTDNMSHKMRLLDHILADKEMGQAIVFASTKRQANEIAQRLKEKGHLSGTLHGNMNQRQRTRTIGELRRGEIKILVATDVAARGIDVASLSHIINIDLPYQPEDYIHRIGRTGRAGAKGIAITFASYREEALLSRVNRLMSSPIQAHTIEGLEPKGRNSANSEPEPRRQHRRQQFGNRSGPHGRSNSDRPNFSRPNSARSGGRPDSDRPNFSRPNSDRSDSDRPNFSRPSSARSSGRPNSDRPNSSRPNARPFGRPNGRPSFRGNGGGGGGGRSRFNPAGRKGA